MACLLVKLKGETRTIQANLKHMKANQDEMKAKTEVSNEMFEVLS
jgi:hypothetical protein